MNAEPQVGREGASSNLTVHSKVGRWNAKYQHLHSWAGIMKKLLIIPASLNILSKRTQTNPLAEEDEVYLILIGVDVMKRLCIVELETK